MTGRTGRAVPNQFVIWTTEYEHVNGELIERDVKSFQSYGTIIAKEVYRCGSRQIYLDQNAWNYSTTTGKYRNKFLGETKQKTERKIKSGEYILADLN